jgi:hypothetical protein
MNIVTTGKPTEVVQSHAEQVEGAIRGLVRRELGSARRPQPAQPPQSESVESHPPQVGVLIQRVAITSVKEIEKLINELANLRDFLTNESRRVQREIEGYARLSEEALKSTRIIAESVTQWKRAVESTGDTEAR